MSRAIKVGDLVRISGNAFTNPVDAGKVRHHIKSGAVCVVEYVDHGRLYVRGPCRKDCRPGHEHLNDAGGIPTTQWVFSGQCKLAKQAMKKREAYANRR